MTHGYTEAPNAITTPIDTRWDVSSIATVPVAVLCDEIREATLARINDDDLTLEQIREGVIAEVTRMYGITEHELAASGLLDLIDALHYSAMRAFGEPVLERHPNFTVIETSGTFGTFGEPVLA